MMKHRGRVVVYLFMITLAVCQLAACSEIRSPSKLAPTGTNILTLTPSSTSAPVPTKTREAWPTPVLTATPMAQTLQIKNTIEQLYKIAPDCLEDLLNSTDVISQMPKLEFLKSEVVPDSEKYWIDEIADNPAKNLRAFVACEFDLCLPKLFIENRDTKIVQEIDWFNKERNNRPIAQIMWIGDDVLSFVYQPGPAAAIIAAVDVKEKKFVSYGVVETYCGTKNVIVETPNCIKTPGLWGCDPSAPAIPGKAAFYDSTGKLVVIDLSDGTGWQVALPQPDLFSWSPDGSQLLVQTAISENAADIKNKYVVYDAHGKRINAFEAGYRRWREDGTLYDYTTPENRVENRVVSSDGTVAWIDYNTVSEKLQLHLQAPSDPFEQTLSMDACHVARVLRLYALFPEDHNLIAYMPEGSVANDVMTGSEICWIDTQARTTQSTGLHGHLGIAGLSELKGDILAVVDRQREVMPFGRLALLNGRTSQVQFPLPESTVVRELAWQPGSSEWLALATAPREGAEQKPDPYMPVAGIYLYNFRSGEVCLLVQTEAGWRDGLLRWSKDGKFLIYAHFEYSEDRPTASLMVYRMADGKSWPLVINLASPVKRGPYLSWNGDLAMFMD